MIDLTNPAGRLYSLLSAAKNQNPKTPVRDVWSSVLGCAAKEDAEITRRVVELNTLADEIVTRLVETPGVNHNLYLTSFKRLRKALFPLVLDAPWENGRQNLTDEAMTRLQFCADVLGQQLQEELIPDEELSSLLDSISTLAEAIASSALPQPLRLILMEQTERLRFAVSLYRIKGGRGVREALQTLLGTVVSHSDEMQQEKERSADVLEKLGALIDKLDTFAARALKIRRLLSHPWKAALSFLGKHVDAIPQVEAEPELE